MSNIKCEKCGRITDMAVSKWINRNGCYAALEDNIWVQGCIYDEADNFMKKIVNELISKNCGCEPIDFRKALKSSWIVIEGVDGTGKTSLAFALYEYFNQHYPTVLTKEPGSPNNKLCQDIRKIIMNSNSQFADIFLFLADRAVHFEKVVEPALKNKSIVVQDRNFLSTLVYQGENETWDVKKLCLSFELNLLNHLRINAPFVILLETSEKAVKERHSNYNKYDEFDKTDMRVQSYRKALQFAVEEKLVSGFSVIDTTNFDKKATFWRALSALAVKSGWGEE